MLFFACFRFLIFLHFSRGSADPICPYVRTPIVVYTEPKQWGDLKVRQLIKVRPIWALQDETVSKKVCGVPLVGVCTCKEVHACARWPARQGLRVVTETPAPPSCCLQPPARPQSPTYLLTRDESRTMSECEQFLDATSARCRLFSATEIACEQNRVITNKPYRGNA